MVEQRDHDTVPAFVDTEDGSPRRSVRSTHQAEPSEDHFMLKVARKQQRYLHLQRPASPGWAVARRIPWALTIAIYATAMIDSLSYFDVTIAGISLPQIVRGALLVLLLAGSLNASWLTRWIHPLALPLICLPLYSIFPALVAGVPLVTTGVYVLRLAFPGAILLSTATALGQRRIDAVWLRRAAWSVLLLTIASQLLGTLFEHRAPPAGYERALWGLTLGPSIIAATLVSVVPLFLYVYRRPAGLCSSIGLSILVVLMTMRRSGIAAVAAALAIYVGVTLYRKGARQYVLAVAAVATVLGGLVVTQSVIGTDLVARFAEADIRQGGTASGRTKVWSIAWEHIKERGSLQQLVGEGPVAAQRTMLEAGMPEIGAHSDWLDLVFSTGLIGVVLYAWFYLRLLHLAGRLMSTGLDSGIACLAGVTAIFVLGVTTGGALDPGGAAVYVLFAFAAHELATGRPLVTWQEWKRDNHLRRLSHSAA